MRVLSPPNAVASTIVSSAHRYLPKSFEQHLCVYMCLRQETAVPAVPSFVYSSCAASQAPAVGAAANAVVSRRRLRLRLFV